MTSIAELLKALLFGIVEGITEWLPISSTGHLIILEELVSFRFSDDPTFLKEFWEMFEVVIQMGAILAVVLVFWHTLWPFSKKKSPSEKRETWNLWFHVVVASVPAAIAGIGINAGIEALSGKDIDGWLYHAPVVAVALIVYGVAFLWIEKRQNNAQPKVTAVSAITYKQAFIIGAFQMLALVPGTSRSGSTILGAILLGLSRPAGAEFSFFMAIPVVVGASGIKALGFALYVAESNVSVPSMAWATLALGFAVSFAVSIVSIRFLMDFVKRHSFAPFGVYRIALGAMVILWQFLH